NIVELDNGRAGLEGADADADVAGDEGGVGNGCQRDAIDGQAEFIADATGANLVGGDALVDHVGELVLAFAGEVLVLGVACLVFADGVIAIAANEEDVEVFFALVAADDTVGVVVGAVYLAGAGNDDGVVKVTAGVCPPDLPLLAGAEAQRAF